jgi:hypothetical protein
MLSDFEGKGKILKRKCSFLKGDIYICPFSARHNIDTVSPFGKLLNIGQMEIFYMHHT